MRNNSNSNSLTNEHSKSDERSVLEQALEEYYDVIEVEGECDVEALANKYPAVSDKLTRCIHSLGILRTLLPNDSRSDLHTVPPMETLGDFRIVRELGRGGMGIVYEAEQISLDRRVALKVLPFAATLDANHMRRFKNEARAAAMLKHSNIVSVFSVGCERGVHYIAMELIEGRSLAEEISMVPHQKLDSPAAKSSKQFDSSEHADHDRVTVVNGVNATAKSPQNRIRAIAERAATIAEALHFAHQTGVVHRDIKPSNLLLDHEGKVYVSDFGLAQINADNKLTVTGDLVGTLRYMSPEQIDGSGIVDHRTDVYSLGLTIYEILARRPAFSETNRNRLAKQIVEESPKPLRHFAPAISADLETIVSRAIEKERDLRYQTCQELADDLRSFIDDRPIKARRSSRIRRTWKWFVRNPWIAASLVTVFLLLVIGITSTSWQLRRAIAAEQKSLSELYGSEMQLAFEAWLRGDLGQVESKLKRFSDRNEFSNVRGLEWTFLNRQLQNLASDSMIQCDGSVRSLAISPDGSRFLSATGDRRSISSWNFATRQKQWSVSGITYPLLTAYSPDGSLVATSSEKGLWICDASDGRIVSRIDLGGKLVRHASFVNALDGQAGYDLLIAIASGTDDDGGTKKAELFHWIQRDHKMVAVDPQPPRGITALVFSRDRSRVAINHDNNSIGLYDPTTWAQIGQLGQHRGRVRLLAFFDEDRSLVSSPGRVLGSDSRTRFWNISMNQETFPLPASETIGKDIVVSPVSKKAAVLGAEPGSFEIWDLSTGESKQVRGHRGQVLCAAWTPNGKTLLTGGEDGTIRFWDVDKVAIPKDDTPVAHHVELILHNQAVYTASTNFDNHSPSVIQRYVLDDGPSGEIRNPEVFGTTREHSTGLALIDEQTMASCASGGIVEFWNLKTRESLSVKVTESKLWPSAMAASSDGNTLAIGRFAQGGGQSPVEIVRNVDGEWKLIRTLEMPEWPMCVCFTDDGKTLAGSDWKGNLQLWSVSDGKMVANLAGHTEKINAIRFSPDGKRLATASSDRTVRVWDLDLRECVSILNHFHEVFSLAYSNDGQRLITGTVQGWLSFWDPDAEQFLGRFQTGDYSIGAVEFSKDGSGLVAATVDGDCKLFNLASR